MTFPDALQACDMLLIDHLHAFDYSLDEQDTLHIESMDGRVLKRWSFTLQEQQDAVARPATENEPQAWTLVHDGKSHTLQCVSAHRASEDETDTPS